MEIGPAFEEEKAVLVLKPSLLANTGWFIAGVITIPIVIGFFILVALWIARYFDSYTITTKRIIDREGLISKYTTEIFLRDIRSVNLNQNILQRIFNVGDIYIGTSATAGMEISLEGIAYPQKVKETIIELKEKAL